MSTDGVFIKSDILVQHEKDGKATDLMFLSNNQMFDIRSVGVLIKNDMLLVQREKDGNEYAIPGGHIKFGETLENGLIREYKEETGVDIKCKRLLWTEECFWGWGNKKAHTLAFYYLIEMRDEDAMLNNGEFVSQKDNCNVLLGWLPLEKIKDIIIYPAFIKESIFNMQEPHKHFVSR